MSAIAVTLWCSTVKNGEALHYNHRRLSSLHLKQRTKPDSHTGTHNKILYVKVQWAALLYYGEWYVAQFYNPLSTSHDVYFDIFKLLDLNDKIALYYIHTITTTNDKLILMLRPKQTHYVKTHEICVSLSKKKPSRLRGLAFLWSGRIGR